jgi:hypothetical protein
MRKYLILKNQEMALTSNKKFLISCIVFCISVLLDLAVFYPLPYVGFIVVPFVIAGGVGMLLYSKMKKSKTKLILSIFSLGVGFVFFLLSLNGFFVNNGDFEIELM